MLFFVGTTCRHSVPSPFFFTICVSSVLSSLLCLPQLLHLWMVGQIGSRVKLKKIISYLTVSEENNRIRDLYHNFCSILSINISTQKFCRLVKNQPSVPVVLINFFFTLPASTFSIRKKIKRHKSKAVVVIINLAGMAERCSDQRADCQRHYCRYYFRAAHRLMNASIRMPIRFPSHSIGLFLGNGFRVFFFWWMFLR